MQDFTQHLPLEDPVRARVRKVLQPGETLVWLQQPAPKFFATSDSMLALIFGACVWMPFMLFMCYLMIDIDLLIEDPSPARIFMLLVLLIFICMGIILILVPLCRRQQMKQVIYAITNYRALIFGEQVPLLSDQDYNYSVFDSQREWRRNGCFRSLYKKDLIAFTRRICKNNRSDLFFAEEGVFYPDPAIFDRLTQKTPPRQSTLIGFFNIINSREAEDWLRRIEEVPPLQMPEKFTVVASKKKQLKVTATRAKESKS